jgi:heme-degrading monooxygenase HmoA
VHAVVFEFRPYPEKRDAYFALVAELRPELLQMPGFLENERFQSRRDLGLLLSFQLWADEDAIARWRAHHQHQMAQARGRSEIFQAYRLRVGEVVPDDGPADLRLAFGQGLAPADASDGFESIVEAGKGLLVGGEALISIPAQRRLAMRIIRDYGRGTLG